jgi:hypothetical protein
MIMMCMRSDSRLTTPVRDGCISYMLCWLLAVSRYTVYAI